MKSVRVYTVRTRKGVLFSSIRLDDATGYAKRFFYRRHIMPLIDDELRTPTDHTAQTKRAA